MAKLYLDYTSIENVVLNDINIALKRLDDAICECDKMMIPKDFEFENYLNQLATKNRNTARVLNNKKSNLKKIINSYKKASTTNADNFSKIQIFDIPTRKNML